MTKLFCRQFAVTACLVLAFVLPTASVSGAKESSREQLDVAENDFNRAKGLTLAILRRVKQIDQQYRTSSGEPLEELASAARHDLATVKLLLVSFRDISESLGSRLDELATVLPDEKSRLEEMRRNLRKYQRTVDKVYNRAVADFGEPTPQEAHTVGLQPGSKLAISGEVSALLGKASYKRPNTNPVIDQSSADFGLGANAKWIPNNKLNFNGKFSRRSTVQQQEIGLTDFGLGGAWNMSRRAVLSFGLDKSWYSENDSDVNDFSDFGLFGRLDLQGPRFRFNTTLRQESRSYDEETIIAADYTTTSLISNATLPFGRGNLKLGLRYLKKGHDDTEWLDYKELTPSAVWELIPGGTELAVSYQKLSHPEIDDDPRDVGRLKAGLIFKKRYGATGRTEWGPAIARYSYPNADDNNYTDLKLTYRKQSADDGLRMASLDVVYRLYSGDSQYDFAQFRWQKTSNPDGSGRYGNLNLSVRVYTEASDEDDPLRYANLCPPHTVDFLWRFGWSRSGLAVLRNFSIGPIIGARAYIDTERHEVFDEDLLDVDFLWRNPQNNIRAGVDCKANLITYTGITIDGEIKYERSFLYNADPTRSTGVLTFQTRAGYRINSQLIIDGEANLHRTRASIDSYSDLNKTGVRFQLRYLFDVQR